MKNLAGFAVFAAFAIFSQIIVSVSPGTTEGNYRYFVRTEGSDKTGTYLHKKDEKRIRSLCQKKYDGDSMLSTYTSLSEGIKCQAEFILE